MQQRKELSKMKRMFYLFFVSIVLHMVLVNGNICSSCRFMAYHCSNSSHNDSMLQNKDLKYSISKDSTQNFISPGCDKNGQIQIDDLFCNEKDCTCASGKSCVNLVTGCTQMIHMRNTKRCVSSSGILERFQKCARDLQLTDLSMSNVAGDWIYYRDAANCESIDCQIIRQFHFCSAVQCGHLLVVWKDEGNVFNGEDLYHVIVDGSRSDDLKAGILHYTFPISSNIKTQNLQCNEITSEVLPVTTCYNLQTRNQNNNCNGIYLQLDSNWQNSMSAIGYVNEFSQLEWIPWLAVVGSICSAALSLAIVIIVIYRSSPASTSQTQTDIDNAIESCDCGSKKQYRIYNNHRPRQRVADTTTS